MSEPAPRAAGARVSFRAMALGCAIGVASALATPLMAQLAPRLSAQVALDELSRADDALRKMPASGTSPALASVRRHLASLGAALQQAMGSDASTPVELVGDALRAKVQRAHAAALRVQAFVAASGGCQAMDATAVQQVLDATLQQFISAGGVAKLVPVIEGVEGMDQQPLFALRQDASPQAFALTGVNLADTQCASPTVIATDVSGKALAVQPVVSGAVPTRIELRWPATDSVPVGDVQLHVHVQHKAFLVGCTALPEAGTVIRVLPPVHFQVDYSLSARCAGGAADVSLGQGDMPPLNGYGAIVSQRVDTTACPQPQSYSLRAGVTQGDGKRIEVGPFTQTAQASITAGLPGGLSMNWNPAARAIFVRAGVAACKAIH